MFESDVISDGTQIIFEAYAEGVSFESDVISDGTQIFQSRSYNGGSLRVM